MICEGVHGIGLPPGMAKGGCSRAYLFEHGDALALVDTLWDEDANVILQYLWSIGRSPTDIRHIVLSHAHRSHLGGLATLRRLSNAEVCSHRAEAPIIEGKENARPIRLWPLRPLKLYPFRVASHFDFVKHVPCKVDRPDLEDGSTVGPLTVVHTPGHTPGHLAFSYRDSVLAVGDAIATWPRIGAGWPGFNLDEHAYRASLRRLVDRRPEVVGPGHGEPITQSTAEVLRTLS